MLGLDPFILRQLGNREWFLWRGLQLVALLNGVVGGFAAGSFAVLVFGRAEAGLVGVVWGLVFLNLQGFVFSVQDEAPLRFGTLLTLMVKSVIMCFFALLVAAPLGVFLFAAPEVDRLGTQQIRLDALHAAHEERRAVALREIAVEVDRIQGERALRQSTVDTLRAGLVGADKGRRLMTRQLRDAERAARNYAAQAEAQLTALRERERVAVEADERERALIEAQFRDQVFVLERVRSVYALHGSDCQRLWGLLCLAYCTPFWIRRLLRKRLRYFELRHGLEEELRVRVERDFTERYTQIVREGWQQPGYSLRRS